MKGTTMRGACWRAAHTGSVNAYAAYAVVGALAVIATLTLT